VYFLNTEKIFGVEVSVGGTRTIVILLCKPIW